MRQLRMYLIGALLCLSFTAGAAEIPNKEMKAVLDELGTLGGKPIESLPPPAARLQPSPADAVKALMAKQKIAAPASPVTTEDIQIDGASGRIAARVYRPAEKGPLPLIVYYHGGGFVIATIDTYDSSPRALADNTKAIVLSIEYRKAPEHKFPSAHEDAFAAYRWALTNAATLGADPKRIAVAGESAGANLALNVAIRARDSGVMLPKHELLVYPIAGVNLNTESYKENGDAKPLNKAMMVWFFDKYLRSEGDKADPRINLSNANLKGLNPATVITAQIDPLRSEGKSLADNLVQQGVKVKYENYKGVTHEFFGMGAVLKEAEESQKLAAKELVTAFQTGDPSKAQAGR